MAFLTLDGERIAALRSFLDDLQYDAVQRSLRSNYAQWPFPAREAFEKATTQLPEAQRLAYEVLLLGKPASRDRLARAWGSPPLETLLDLGLLEATTAFQVRTARYAITSYFGRYFVVSLNPYYPGSKDPDASVYIGPDSFTLAGYLLGPLRAGRALDLCAGSGIQSILIADRVGAAVAVELNEEAVSAARFNALLNGVADRVEVLQGSLYDAAPAGAYDLIVSNPPFIPVPASVPFAMCGDGGEDGLTVLRPLLEGLPPRLTEDGLAVLYAEGVGDAAGPFVRRLLLDLAQREGLDVQLIVVSRLSVKGALVLRAMSLSRLGRDGPGELGQWRDLYQRLGATHLFNYVLQIRRGSARLTQRMAFDPGLEERGFELQPGVIVKPR